MTRKRKAPVPASPPPPQPEIPWPDWLAQRRRALHVAWGTQGLRRIGECDYWLPPMQRPVVWTREQQLTYVRTLWAGMPCAPIILWDSYRVDGVQRMWILDGQQRLTAIGAHIRTADGTPRPPTRFCFDPVDGRWLDDPGQPGQSLIETVQRRLDLHGDLVQLGQSCAARTIAEEIEIPVARIDCPVADLVDAFTALARPGVPWSAADVDALADSFRGWSP